MFNLDPGKLLVIAVVAIILLGPDRLPQVARQVGSAWRAFNEFRHRVESQVRETVPDLPPTSEIARLARSPAALLNHLSSMSADPPAATSAGAGPATGPGSGEVGPVPESDAATTGLRAPRAGGPSPEAGSPPPSPAVPPGDPALN